MNTKTIILATSALALLAACSKSEVLPVESAPQEITFQTVETKDASSFSTSNKFYSYAYFLPSDKILANGNSWATNYANGTPYISGSLIEYVSGETAWRNASTHYYWPKQGQLTFFAWTDYTASPSINGSSASVSCANNTGITFGNYSIISNPNQDLMVAKIAADQTSKTTTQHDNWKAGVPTVFQHALSDLKFTVKTDDTDPTKYTNVSFTLKSITLKNVNTIGNYAQGSPTATNTWSDQADAKNLNAYSGTEITVTKTEQEVKPSTNDYHIVLPQTFSNATPVIEVVYTITTNYTTTPVVETVTVTKALNTIYTDNWASGKKYTLNIILGLEEILWDPSYEDWATGTGGEINI